MIPHEEVIGYPLDNLQHLSQFLISMRDCCPNSPHVLFKCDIVEAYWLLSVHPYWQLEQVNHIGGSLHINRNTTFGGQASSCNWIAFMSLVSWTAKKKRSTELLGTYSDDSFGPELASNVTWYSLYHILCQPTNKSDFYSCGMKSTYWWWHWYRWRQFAHIKSDFCNFKQ